MTRFTLFAMAAAVTMSGVAFAQGGPMPDPYGDTTVTKADFANAAAERFDQLDTNHDGTLSADEIDKASGPGARGLRRADTNGDGSVSKDEFMTMQNSRFDMMDSNHDGKLTKAERDAFRASMMQRMRSGGWGGGQGGSPGGSGQ